MLRKEEVEKVQTAALVSHAGGPDGGELGAIEPEPIDFEDELLASLDETVLPNDAREAVVRELRTAQMELRAVFLCYSSERDLLVAPADGELAIEDSQPNAKAMPLATWKQLCADCGIDGLSEVDEAFAASASGVKESAPVLDEVQFYGALVRLAGRLADAAGITKSLYTLLYECILPFARREGTTTISQVLSSRSYLLPYLEEIRASFSGFGVSWEQWLKLWPQLKLAGLPGFPFWERQVFSALSNNLGVLLRIFSYYAKQTLKRLLGAGMGTASAGANAIGAVASGAGSKQHTSGMTLVIGKHEWLAFVRDCKLFSKKLVRTAEDR